MNRDEFELLGISVELFETLFNEKLVFDTVSNNSVISLSPVAAPVEPVAAVDSMSFKNIKAAAEFIASKRGVKVSNALDCLYKIKRSGSNKTHGYSVKFFENKTVALTLIV